VRSLADSSKWKATVIGSATVVVEVVVVIETRVTNARTENTAIKHIKAPDAAIASTGTTRPAPVLSRATSRLAPLAAGHSEAVSYPGRWTGPSVDLVRSVIDMA
jgi:hypothetical protein